MAVASQVDGFLSIADDSGINAEPSSLHPNILVDAILKPWNEAVFPDSSKDYNEKCNKESGNQTGGDVGIHAFQLREVDLKIPSNPDGGQVRWEETLHSGRHHRRCGNGAQGTAA